MVGYFESGVTEATQCPENCTTCASLEICLDCNVGFENNLGQCVLSQPRNLAVSDGGIFGR
jgi:hypothetical protein